MNKKLIFAASFALACSSMTADTLNFGYCTDELTGVGHNAAGVHMAAAMRVPANLAKEFAGNKISAVSIGFGASTPKRVTLFLTYDLAEEPFYTQLANLKVNRFNDVPLMTPYEFEDRDVFVGYKITTTTASDYPIGFDKLAYSYSEDGDWYASSLDADNLNSTWRHVGSDMGNASIRLLVEGDNLAAWQRRADPIAVQVPPFVSPGKEFDVTLSLQNNGVQPLESVEALVSTPDRSVTKVLDLEAPLASGKCTIVSIPGISTDLSGNDIPLAAEIIKVNGDDNQSAGKIMTAQLTSSAYLSRRPLIIEEATGIWCGYCVAGYAALEGMREKYTDGSYIGIAVHNHGGRGADAEPMHCSSYEGFIGRYITGYPQALANRLMKFSPQPSEVRNMYDKVTELPASVFVDVEAYVKDEDPSKAVVKVNTRAPKTISGHAYGVAVVVTEDNVGPYMQTNYYAGGSLGEMDGFEKQPAKVLLTYNDVARDIFDWTGNTAAVPSTIEAEADNIYEREISLANVGDPANAHVIALLIDTATQQIETGASCRFSSLGASVSPRESGWKVSGSNGTLHVAGDDVDNVRVYSLSGALCAEMEGPGAADLPHGVYVVAVETKGETFTEKIIL